MWAEEAHNFCNSISMFLPQDLGSKWAFFLLFPFRLGRTTAFKKPREILPPTSEAMCKKALQTDLMATAYSSSEQELKGTFLLFGILAYLQVFFSVCISWGVNAMLLFKHVLFSFGNGLYQVNRSSVEYCFPLSEGLINRSRSN